MVKVKRAKIYFISCLSAIFIFVAFSPYVLARETDPFSKIQEKLQGISDEERQVLQTLFSLTHEIEEMEKEEEGLNQEIDGLKKDISSLETQIKADETSYEQKKDVLKQVLLVYERRGPGSYLEIIMDSENLNTFLWRISTLQDLSRNTGKLLETLEESKDKLTEEKSRLSQKLSQLEDKQKQLKESLDKNMKLKEDKEQYLASLEGERGHYQEQLDNLQQVWNQLKLTFKDASAEFTNLIKDGKLPLDAVKMTFTLHGIEGVIDEKTFNDILSKDMRLKDIYFGFNPGRIEIWVDKMDLVVHGTFEIVDGCSLNFVPEDGSFYGIALEPGAVNELFEGGGLRLDLKSLIGDSKLDSVEISEDYLKFIIKPFFFSSITGGKHI